MTRLALTWLAVGACALAGPARAEAPLDGTWTTTGIQAELAEACPSYFAPMADQMQANIGRKDSYDLTWGGVFDPNAAQGLDPDDQGVVWTQLPDGRWEGNLSGTEANYVTATMEMLDPARIVNRVFMDIELMMSAEGGALPGVEDCTLSMTYKMIHESAG